MTILPIGTNSAALFFTSGDLMEHGISIDSISGKDTAALIRNALHTSPLTLYGRLTLDVYPSPHGLLVFASADTREREVWRFFDFESMLAALRSMAEVPSDGLLYLHEGDWWLVLPDCRPQLCEFAQEERGAPYITAWLEEHAVPISPQVILGQFSQ